MAFTLATLRDRARTMLMNASGFTEPLVVNPSTETLATLRDRVELKLQDGKITEAEHLLADINPNDMDNLKTPRSGLVTQISEAKRMNHAELVKIGASYYDALDDNDGTLMPFADDCQRQENSRLQLDIRVV